MAKQHTGTLLIMITVIATLMQICTDVYTPSIPAIAHDLGGTIGQAQLTMAYFIAGVAVTNLIYGPLSEGIGRRWTLVIGISIGVIGVIICLCAYSITMMQFGRLIQGCGLGATAALWRSIFRDTFSGEELARRASYLVNFIILSVILAPFIGGYFEQYLGWHATFIFMLCWMLFILFFIMFKFKETSQHHGKHRLKLQFVFKSYLELLTNRLFVTYTLMIFLTYGGLFAWITAGPAVLIHGLGVKPVYFGYLMIATGVATGVASTLNARLLKYFSLHRVLILGLGLMSIAGISLLILDALFDTQVIFVLIAAVLFVFGSSLLFLNCFALAFEKVGHIAGYAGAVYACIQQLGGACFSGILGHLSTNSPTPMAVMFTVSGIGAALIYIALQRKKNN